MRNHLPTLRVAADNRPLNRLINICNATRSVAKPAVAALALAAVAFAAACGSPIQTSVSAGTDPPSNYPLTLVESREHRETMSAEWTRLFEAHGVPVERRRVPELTPVLHTPQSILGIGPIRLGTSAAGSLDDAGIRLLLRKFIADYSQLLGVAPSTLSLEGVTTAGGLGNRYTFTQNGFAHPIAPPAGRLEFTVSPAGELIQMSVTTIPLSELPEPRLTRATAGERVIGTTFTYGDKRGAPQTVTVSDPAQVVVKRLVVYPHQTESTVSIRLCWEVEAGDGMTWTVFVDAITGQIVGTVQNFQT